MGEKVKKWLVSSKAIVSMLMVQVFATGVQLLAKVILNNGTFVFALMAYRHVVAALCVAPFALYFERGITEKLSWLAFFWLFLSALSGISLAMGLFYYGVRDTTATYAVNFLNLVPILTFVLSTITRIEKLGLRTPAGKIKILGATLCIVGALTSGFYKGKSFHIFHHNLHRHVDIKASNYHWLRGSFLLIASCLSYAAWYILQVKLIKELPLKYWATMLTCIIAAIQSAVIGLCLDRSKVAWKLGWDLQLVTILYSGALGTAATFCLISWAVENQGPTYPSMFNPLTLIFVAILEALILGSEINVGNLVGMVLIVVGLYSFLLGKRTEMKNLHQPDVEAITSITKFQDTRIQFTTADSITNVELSLNKSMAKP
ncbi:WAT1-related protein At5g64700 isoform X1 [Ricinus communis]|uniref:WAT1-related protein n=1 Tax=Ricinus communis TaxID=3988 RepID=B9S0T3_RICCO|nr:WAT1-related protein At5g64700 isoform X1 [Ricinus communis]XP_048226843.1 WAT1-related protein At5g64700 isoform X1 [Ricinus communis]EEF42747.1 Auxin-induced protein 5NG4, putative [Ricinus communis]|eukprot:XP_002519602.1 WAT1-related protein At5g64700 [Ricinus communis]